MRKTTRNRRDVIPFAFPVLYVSCFALLAWYFLYVRNADTLFFLQDRGRWNSTGLFWDECVRVPGGFLSWLGSYLTQFFYHPALGCVMLTGLWVFSYLIAKWSFRVSAEWSFLLFIPHAALLCSNIQLGYWVYVLKDIDYVFYHPLGLFFALILSLPYWDYLPVSRKVQQWMPIAWIPVLVAMFYYPLGIYALLAAVIVAIRTSWKAGLVLVPTIWLVPLLETSGTTLMRPDQPWMYGFHRFELDSLRDFSLETPFYVAFAATVLIPIIGKIKQGKLLFSQSVMMAVSVIMFYCLSVRDFDDYNFHAELRMQRGVEECRWDDVLCEAAKAKRPVTREMVMFRNIALINRGELCSKCYKYNNESIQPATANDSIYIRIADQAGDLIYYNYGETVFAIRRAIERCMHYGYSHYTLRMLTRCALINGEMDNARKYLRLLNRTTFQKEWAAEMSKFAEGRAKLAEDARFRMPMKLYNEGSELVGVDDRYVELTIVKKWMSTLTNDPEAQEVALGCAMMMRDWNCFWSQVQQHYNINPDKPFPTHVQEAMLLDVYELKMQGVNLSFVKFDERVIERYKAFFERLNRYSRQGLTERQIGAALRSEFGDTYMWDYSVLREVQTN